MATRQAIISTAIDLFNERGVNHVGVRDIARALNMSPGNLSYHFKKKEDLLAVILETYSQINAGIRAEYRMESPHFGRFMHMFVRIFQNQYTHRGVLSEIVEVNRLLRTVSDEDYSSGQSTRVAEFTNLMIGLQRSGSMKQSEDALNETLRLLTLYGRFWIAEAFLNMKGESETIIEEYATLLAKLLRHYATDQGVSELQDFLEHA
jgi:AcrR family transcriptional regulator